MIKTSKKRKPIVIAVIFVLITAGIIIATQRHRWQERGVEYQIVAVSKGTIRKEILATGVVRPENRLELKPPIPGRIDKILVEEGWKVSKGRVLAWMSSQERAALLDTARSKGPDELKYWEDAYKATPIIAPINGIIILKNVEQGQTVTQADAIVVMSDRLAIKAHVDETDIAEVKIDQKVEVTLDAFPKDIFPAKVTHIAYDAKTVSNVTTYEVDVVPEEVPAFMKSGMTANTVFVVQQAKEALIVPAGALKREEGNQYVLVPGPKANDNQFDPVQRKVATGISDGKQVEIVEGLQENEKVLLAIAKPLTKKDKSGSNPLTPMGGNRGRGRH